MARPGDPVRHLAALLAPGGPQAQVPATSAAWAPLLAVATHHRLTPALWSALRRSQVIDAVPAELARHWEQHPGDRLPVALALDRSHRVNAAHVADLCRQGEAILTALGTAGIRAIPLKGIDAVFAGRYPDPAARTMTDIDILVAPTATDDAETVLERLGYVTVPAPASPHQLAPRRHPGSAGSVELHRALLARRWAGAADAVEVLTRSSSFLRTGRPLLRSSRTDAATHLLAHAALHDEAYLLWHLPLRALHETALLISGPEDVEWDEVLSAFSRVGRHRAVLAHLALTASLFAVSSPVRTDRVCAYRARVTVGLARHPRTLQRVDQIIWLPRALNAERMAGLYGAGDSRSRTRARLRHIRHALRRAARAPQKGRRGPVA